MTPPFSSCQLHDTLETLTCIKPYCHTPSLGGKKPFQEKEKERRHPAALHHDPALKCTKNQLRYKFVLVAPACEDGDVQSVLSFSQTFSYSNGQLPEFFQGCSSRFKGFIKHYTVKRSVFITLSPISTLDLGHP